jgi:uncharacterized protein
MSTTTLIILLCIGLVAGVLSGVIGIGGGIVVVPALVFILGFSQKMAQGTSLGLLLLPAGILAVLQYYKAGNVNLQAVFILAIGFIVGGYFGGKFTQVLPDNLVKKVFAIMLIVVAIKMLFLDKAVGKSTSNQQQTQKL